MKRTFKFFIAIVMVCVISIGVVSSVKAATHVYVDTDEL